MQAIWLENRRLTLKVELPVPEPTAEEALIRVLRAGICNTDLELIKGYYPFRGIIGHEFVGIVELGPQHLVGKRVVGEINVACHHCRECANGIQSHCRNRSVLGIINRNGAFAEYLTLPIENLHPIPDHISTDKAIFTEPLAAALEINAQVDIDGNTSILVVGDGKLGLLIAQTMALSGGDVLVAGRHAEKLEIVSRRGIRTTHSTDIPENSFDIAVECTGNSQGALKALKSLRPRGVLVLKSTYEGQLTLDISTVVVNEITIIGSRCGPFHAALDLLSSGLVDVESSITDRFPLDKGLEAFEKAKGRDSLKVLIDVCAE